jgi:hypothetical protein
MLALLCDVPSMELQLASVLLCMYGSVCKDIRQRKTDSVQNALLSAVTRTVTYDYRGTVVLG